MSSTVTCSFFRFVAREGKKTKKTVQVKKQYKKKKPAQQPEDTHKV